MHAKNIRFATAAIAAMMAACGGTERSTEELTGSLAEPRSSAAVAKTGACTALTNGATRTLLPAVKGAQQCFALAVPTSRTTLVVTTSGGTGNADLSLRFGALPTRGAYDCKSATPTNAESCTIAKPAAGTWYVLVTATTAFSGASVTATASANLVVNSLDDVATPAPGVVTLRAALAAMISGDQITFDGALDGGTILLDVVGDEHSMLRGEVYVNNAFSGYEDRDYGKSALYARKNVNIDASSLPNGITLRWNGASHARVLAVYGNLTMSNVTIASGYSAAEPTGSPSQPYTLARGGGLAVWGTAALTRCTVAGNTVQGDDFASRDRGAYGGGIYANGLQLREVVVSGNRALGYGAAGGGLYSVGGADNTITRRGSDTSLDRCTVSDNLVRARHAYGGGVFTLSGGPNYLATMRISNTTIARNWVEDSGLETPYYYRGGGVYMGGGSLSVVSSTIAENAVSGRATLLGGKPNMGGGGVAATIGNAHTVEYVFLQNSIVVGNTLNGAREDWFPGSILDFRSRGYNLLGTIDFSQILVPVPAWSDLNRKRWPKQGDLDGVALTQALDTSGARLHDWIVSATSSSIPPAKAVLWYPPGPAALNRIAGRYTLTYADAGYSPYGTSNPGDDFLYHVVLKLRSDHADVLGADFGSAFLDDSYGLLGTTWYGPAVTWPTEAANAKWIQFWHDLDAAIAGRLGMAGLGDDFWGTFTNGSEVGNEVVSTTQYVESFTYQPYDQIGTVRPANGAADIGAIEQ